VAVASAGTNASLDRLKGKRKKEYGKKRVDTSLQTDNHASTPPLSFYRPDALPAAQPTVSKH